MKILLTGFDPFGGEKINPAYEVVRRVADGMDGAEILKLEVPTVYNVSIQQVIARIVEVQPDVWLGIGQAGGRADISVERVAININDGRIPDNAGYQPLDEPVDAAGPSAYFATLPIKLIVEGIRTENIPASVSNSAGTFVCNHLMYGVLNFIQKRKLNMRGGFIHIPYLPVQVLDKSSSLPSMPLEMSVHAVETALRIIARTSN